MNIFRHFQLPALVLLISGTQCVSGCDGSVAGREIRWSNGDVELAGTLALPDGPGPHPLVIFVPGSGCTPRSHDLLREHAAQLTARGLAVFVYDKRGCGKSGGDWKTVGLDALADDVLSALPMLESQSEIDRQRIGLMGISQGAWVSLMAAEKSKTISFAILLSGPPMSPAEQGHAIVELGMRAKGWDKQSIARAVELDRMVSQVYRTDSGWEQAAAEIQRASAEPWFKDVQIGLQPHDSWNWRWLRMFMDYDPLPSFERLDIPILAIYGENDMLVPAARSQQIVLALAPQAKGRRDTHMLHNVGHDLRADKSSPWPDEYWTTVHTWLKQQGVIR